MPYVWFLCLALLGTIAESIHCPWLGPCMLVSVWVCECSYVHAAHFLRAGLEALILACALLSASTLTTLSVCCSCACLWLRWHPVGLSLSCKHCGISEAACHPPGPKSGLDEIPIIDIHVCVQVHCVLHWRRRIGRDVPPEC